MDDKGRIEELELAGHEARQEKRIKELERALREIDAEIEGSTLTSKVTRTIANIIAEVGVRN